MLLEHSLLMMEALKVVYLCEAGGVRSGRDGEQAGRQAGEEEAKESEAKRKEIRRKKRQGNMLNRKESSLI